MHIGARINIDEETPKKQLPFNHLNRDVRPKRLLSYCVLDKTEAGASSQVMSHLSFLLKEVVE